MAIENTELPNEDNLEDILVPQDTSPGPGVQSESAPDLGANQGQAGEAQVPSQSAASSLPASLVDRAKAAGLPLDNIDSSDKLSEFILDRYLQDKAYADYGRSYLATAPTSGGRAPGEAQTNQENSRISDEPAEQAFDVEGHYNTLWQSHKLEPAAEYAIKHGIVVLGEDGLFQAKPGYESLALPVLNQINQAHLSQQEQVKGLFEGNFYQNLDKGLWPAFEHRINQIVNERLGTTLTTYQQEQAENTFIDRWQEENRGWLYTPQGGFTPEGQRFSDAVADLRQHGIKDPQVLAQYAMKIAGVDPNAPQLQPQQPVQQVEVPRRDEHGRFLPAGKPAPAPTKQETFLDRARKHVTASDSRSLGIENNADYQVANEGELENLFTNAWKQAAVV
jgi:hypothetical protein